MKPSLANSLSSVAVSGTTTFNGVAVPVDQQMSLSAQINVTGSTTGSAQLQFSNDPRTVQPTNWSNVPGSSNTVAVSGAGAYAIPFQFISFMWVRIVYTNATNTGTVSDSIKLN